MELTEEEVRKIRKVLLAHTLKLEDKCSRVFMDCLRCPDNVVFKREHDHYLNERDEFVKIYKKFI